MGYESEILLGIVIGLIIFIGIMSIILRKCFPKNNLSDKLENLAEWIKEYGILR